jgi:hypothetical protein
MTMGTGHQGNLPLRLLRGSGSGHPGAKPWHARAVWATESTGVSPHQWSRHVDVEICEAVNFPQEEAGPALTIGCSLGLVYEGEQRTRTDPRLGKVDRRDPRTTGIC